MGQGRGTGSLLHHCFKGCKKAPCSKKFKRAGHLQKLLNMGAPTEGEAVSPLWDFDQDISRALFAKMIIVHEYPFNCVTHYYLKAFLKSLQPEFKLVTRNTVRTDCIKIYENEKLSLYELMSKLECKFSFISDLWTNSMGDRGFMALTCHYIDDSWKIRKRIINFTPLPSPHTGKNIAQAIYDKLVVWNLDKKAFCLVMDNASSNDACIRELLNGPLKDELPVEGSIFQQRCGCHILNLVVQDGLHVLGDEITKIWDAMKFLRGSQARMKRFRLATSQAKVKYYKPAWDVLTRWNSTYLMLERALKLKPAICRYATLDPKNFDLNPSELEWEAIGALMDCLEIFYVATMKFSGTKYPTLNLFFPEFCEVYISIKNMDNSPYHFIVNMGKAMFAKWERYWTIRNTLLAIACVLDPRCKLTVVEYFFKSIYPDNYQWYVTNLEACIKTLFNEYLEEHSKSVQNQAGSSSQGARPPSGSVASSSGPISNIRAGLRDFMQGKKGTEPVKIEMEEYLAEPLDATGLEAKFDILTWWKMKVPKYPVMSRLARDILVVPASTVASEATFSTNGRTLLAVRNSLNNESIEALICAQDWLRASINENDGVIGEALWDNAELLAGGDVVLR